MFLKVPQMPRILLAEPGDCSIQVARLEAKLEQSEKHIERIWEELKRKEEENKKMAGDMRALQDEKVIKNKSGYKHLWKFRKTFFFYIILSKLAIGANFRKNSEIFSQLREKAPEISTDG